MANEPYGESVVEKRIREAQENGAFDNLAGAGKPLPGLHGPDDENWWLRSYVRREGLPSDVLLPTPLRLRKEIARLPETVRDCDTEREVRDVVAALATRVAAWLRAPQGPQIAVAMPRPDEVVAAWRAEREARAPARDMAPRTPAPPPGPSWRARWGRLVGRRRDR
jgi:hypothetical protein